MGNEWQALVDALVALNPIGFFFQFLNVLASILNQWFAGTGLSFQAV